MTRVVIYPHPRYGGAPFSKKVEFNSGVKRTMVSADLVWLFRSMEMVSPSPVASVSGQDKRCTGLVDFSMEYADRTCSLAKWVNPVLQNSIVIGS